MIYRMLIYLAVVYLISCTTTTTLGQCIGRNQNVVVVDAMTTGDHRHVSMSRQHRRSLIARISPSSLTMPSNDFVLHATNKIDNVYCDEVEIKNDEKVNDEKVYPDATISDNRLAYSNNMNTHNSRRSFLKGFIRNTAILASCTAAVTTGAIGRQNGANAVEVVSSAPPTTTASSVSSSTANMNLYQFETAGMVPRIYFEEKRSIYGFVERVMDGDTIRISHAPFYPFDGKVPSPITKRGISDMTIAVRLYGIDAPEVAKNKNQTSQPFGEESKQFTSDTVFHKMVKVTLLQKDKYGRVVGAVETIDGLVPSKDLSIELAKRGLAELYTGGGAQYWVSSFFQFFCSSPLLVCILVVVFQVKFKIECYNNHQRIFLS